MHLNTFELRNYLIQPGMREHFIDYFEEHFIVSQQAAGMHVLGQFRVIGAPDRFVWLRGFSDMAARQAGLRAFYDDGSQWQKHRARTNAMIVDSDQVHLLRPLEADGLTSGRTSGSVAAELADGTISLETGLVAIRFHQSAPSLPESAPLTAAEAYRAAGGQVRGVFVAELAENNYPRLPVIQNPGEFVIISAYPSEAAYQQTRAAGLPPAKEMLLLSPTLRSPLRW